jgi:hypothetical protein
VHLLVIPPLLKSTTTRPVLNTVCGLSALSCTPDDGHNDARNMLTTLIKKIKLFCI